MQVTRQMSKLRRVFFPLSWPLQFYELSTAIKEDDYDFSGDGVCQVTFIPPLFRKISTKIHFNLQNRGIFPLFFALEITDELKIYIQSASYLVFFKTLALFFCFKRWHECAHRIFVPTSLLSCHVIM